MKIACLMGTYGRYSLLCESLASFLQQTALANATLLIYNQHPVPIRFDHPRVRVVNETPPPRPLRDIRKRMLDLADPTAEFIHWWDDDDLYLPWHLQTALDHVGTSIAWKPAKSWVSYANVTFERMGNMFEGAWLFRADYAKAAPLDTHPEYTDHPIFMQTLEAGRVVETELGGRTSYIYRWATGTEHLSGYGIGDEARQESYVTLWRERSSDAPEHGRLIVPSLTLRWRQYLEGVKAQIAPEEWELNRRGVGLADGGASLSAGALSPRID